MKATTHILRGKKFKVVFKAPTSRNNLATCDYDNKEIRVSPKVKGVEKLDCLIHEGLHGALPDLVDDVVNESATGIAKMLWKLGYRRVEDLED